MSVSSQTDSTVSGVPRIVCRLPVRVEFQYTVRHTHRGVVVHFDRVEAAEATCDRRFATGAGDQCMVNTSPRHGIKDQTTPVARRRQCRAGIASRIKRSARPETVVQQRRQDDRVLRCAFSDQVRRPAQRRSELRRDFQPFPGFR